MVIDPSLNFVKILLFVKKKRNRIMNLFMNKKKENL